MKFVMILNMTAIAIIFTLSFTFPIPHMMLKLICSRKINTKRSTEYCNMFQDFINFSQNSMKAIISAKIKNNIFDAIAIMVKFLESIHLMFLIFLSSHLLCISEKRGKRSANIGHIIIKGMVTMLR